MDKNLVIVESPAKAKTIENFLGKDYTVASSFGHIRDLSKSKLGIDIENGFIPQYIIAPEKTKLVADLEKLAKKAGTVWLASDEDREGEAIAWHLQDTLKLAPEKTKRITFHEITKDAILRAIEHPRTVDMNLVLAQQTRRVIDRLVGYEVSPILWRKIKPKLSAGRVQSVALRLLVDREKEILAFKTGTFYKIEALFYPRGEALQVFKADMDPRFTEETATEMLRRCRPAHFTVNRIESKKTTRCPAPPFTTSTLQQEASRKLGFSVSQTMSVAQHLYESGFITYMRTDSSLLSDLALNTCQHYITQKYGADYARRRQFSAKSKGAQEAHEAIRPTFIDNENIEGSPADRHLYGLIRKRTIASQMADAQIEKTQVEIASDAFEEIFTATGESVLFDGFMKVYHEEPYNEKNGKVSRLPKLAEGMALDYQSITATQRFSQHPARYSEAALVKKLEELGIGRPSTYAPTISTIIQRGYATREDRPGKKTNYTEMTLKGSEISTQERTENYGAEKAKLFPSDMGILVTDFLLENLPDIVDYSLTARIEKNLDKIALGEIEWSSYIRKLYTPFKASLENVLEHSNPENAERVLGRDPVSGKIVTARIGRFGPIVQIGENRDPDKRYAGLPKDMLVASICLEDALELFKLPRQLGEYEGSAVICARGRFGPYIKYDNHFVSLEKSDDPYTIDLARAVNLIEQNKIKEARRHIRHFEEGIDILRGRFGPYIACEGKNYKIPRGSNPENLSLEDCRQIIAQTKPAEKKKAATGKKSKK